MHHSSGINKKKNKSWLVLLTAEFIFLLPLSIALFLSVASVYIVFISKNPMFDEKIFRIVSAFVTTSITYFFLFITFLGKHSFLIPAYLVLLAWFLLKRNKFFFLKTLFLSLSSLGLMLLLKNTIQRARPVDPLLESVNGYSFPSGHALMSMVFYGLLIYIIHKEVRNRLASSMVCIFIALLILMIGFSRIYLRVHYTTDVIAGLSIGFIWLTLSLRISNKIESLRAMNKNKSGIINRD